MTISLTVLDSTPINPVTFPTIAGQPVSAPVIGTNGAGWVCAITLPGITSVTGTFDPTQVTLQVLDPGFTTSGATTSVIRTIVGVAVLKRLFQDPLVGTSQGSHPNNNVTYQINVVGGNLVLHITLSDWIYVGTTIISATIGSTFYTGSAGGTPTTTQSSDLAYPLPIFAWHTPHFLSTAGSNTLPVEGMVFHREARNSQQVACVKYQATDQHSNSGAVSVVSGPTLSTWATQAGKPEVWAANIDFSTLTQGDLCTVNAVIYPWIVTAAYNLSSHAFAWPTNRGQTLLQVFNDRTGAYGGGYVYVSQNGNDSTGVASGTPATARANPYLTLGAASTALAAWNNSNKSHNNLGGGFIRMMDNNGSPGTITVDQINGGPGSTWCILEKDPLATSSVTMSASSSNFLSQPSLLYMRNFNYDAPIGSASFAFFGSSASDAKLMMNNMTITSESSAIMIGWYNICWFYNLIFAGNNDPKIFTSAFKSALTPIVSCCTSPNNAVESVTTVSTYIGNYLPLGGSAGFNNWDPVNSVSALDGAVFYNNRGSVMGMNVSVIDPWVQSTNYFTNTLLYNNGNLYFAAVGGTSSNSGTGPSGTGSSITDGGITWSFINAGVGVPVPLGCVLVQNLTEPDNASTGNGSMACFPDDNMATCANIIDMYNTALAGKCNSFYNDVPDSQYAPAGNIVQGTRRFTIMDDQNNKCDGGPGIGNNGCCGAYAFQHGVGNYGNISLFGSVGRGTEDAPFPSGVVNPQATYLSLVWHPTATANLQRVVGIVLNGGGAPRGGGQACAIIMKLFVNFVAGPWGDLGLYPQWITSTVYAAGVGCQNAGNSYYTVVGGTSGGTAPTHLSGTVSDGGVLWTYGNPNFTIGGDYTPVSNTSYLANRVPIGMSALKYDLAGNLRKNNGTGAAGVLEAPGGVTPEVFIGTFM